MIIGNMNNIRNNNFLFSIPMNQTKIIYIAKKLLFFSFIFITISFITYILYINNNSITYIKKHKNLYRNELFFKDNTINMRRDLDPFIINNNISIEDNLKEKMNKGFGFIINLTSNEYVGNWTDLSMKDDYFFDDKINNGIAELFFHKIKSSSISILAKSRINSFKIEAIIKEGKYIDKYIKINFTLYLENDIEKYKNEEEEYIIHNYNTILDFNKIEFLIGKKKEVINRANVTLKLLQEDYLNSPSFKKGIFSPFYNAQLIIVSKDLNVTIETKISSNEHLNQEVRIYSFILSFLGVIEIFYCSKLIMKINNQQQIALKISIITIAINCCFKLVICIIHFFLSVSIIEEDISYQFGIITIIYFFCFIGFELKLLLTVFRIKNEGGENRDIYRRRLLSLYLMFYVGFSFIFFNIKECITNFYLILSIYTISWLSQILVSLCQNTRPPMSRLYILWNSISRLFLPIYMKGFDNNFFDLKPSYFKVILLAIIIITEVIILNLQKSLGPRIIIPKKFRKENQIFDYYKDKVNVDKHVSHNPICVICLENLNFDVDENFNKIKKKTKPKTFGYKIMNILYLNALNEKMKKWIKYLLGKNLKKKYMITPCDHVYHTVCLERWMKQKNECPYCKAEIPSIG